MRTICCDTVMLNELYKQNADGQKLVHELRASGGQLAMNVQVIFELAKSFTSRRAGFENRGKELFAVLENLGPGGMRFLKHPNIVLQEEASFASDERNLQTNPWHDAANSQRIWGKIAELSNGSFNERDAFWISAIQTEAEALRLEGNRFKSEAAAAERDHHELPFKAYINAAWPRWSEPVLLQKLKDAFPRATAAELTPIARKILADHSYRTAHAMVRGDFYVRWRALGGNVSKDVHGDCLNVVHAAYCDVYVTADAKQQKWAPYLLTTTRFALYSDVAGPLASWLVSLLRHTSTTA